LDWDQAWLVPLPGYTQEKVSLTIFTMHFENGLA
jgi:hypothetical protein